MTGLSPYALTPEDFAEAVRQDWSSPKKVVHRYS